MKFRNIVVLTGAGISAESGLGTFRGAGGLWEGHKVEEVASLDGFLRNPDLVQTFYNQRRRQLQSSEVHPNGAHKALAKLEKQHQGQLLLVTQNVDNLHERGGSQHVHHMHGELLKARCLNCHSIEEWLGDIIPNSKCRSCDFSGMRPHIVWFGEMPLGLDEALQKLQECDLFISIGTSGNVYPAAGFVSHAQKAFTVELNLEESMVSSRFKKTISGPATQIVPEFVESVLDGKISW